MNRWSTSRWSARRTLLASGGLAAGAAVLAVVVAGLPRSGPGDAAGRTGTGAAGLGPVQSVALRSFKDCDDLLRYYRENAARIVGPYGLPGQGMAWAAGAAESGRAAMATPSAPGGAQAADGSTSSTGTNVQVAGVDEADVAKLSGGLLLTVADGALRVSTVAGGKVTAAGTLRPADWTPHQMLVHGDTVLVTGYVVPTEPTGTTLRSSLTSTLPMGSSRIAEVDVSDPAKPRLVRSIDVNGSVVGARLVAGVARLAVTSSPGPLSFAFPDQLPGRGLDPNGAPTKATLDLATAHNRKVVRAAGLDAWLPTYTLTTYDAAGRATGTPDKGRLLDCAQVASPREFAGVDTVSLLTLDLATGIQEWDSAGVVATGSSVYATAGHTYVTTSAWLPQWTSQWATSDTGLAPAQPDRTAVHLFRTTDGTASEYVASGEVPGSLHDQFSMDEHDGVLRVATTTTNVVTAKPLREEGAGSNGNTGSTGSADEPVSDDDSVSSPVLPQEPQTVSQVTVLRQQGDRLVRVGSVGGLGKTETIRSVRFMGDVGYVVTFRQTDPLYTIDLTDPGRPAVVGELKIPGYSGYLHPAGPGRLLGVGQDADAQGRVKGVQLSLFDVSDPAGPRRLDAVGLPNTWSEADGDHHAFTFAGDLALVPYWAENGSGGVLAVRAGNGDLAAPVTLAARPGAPRTTDGGTYPMRTFVRDGVVYTVTNTGVATHDAARLTWTAFSAFGS